MWYPKLIPLPPRYSYNIILPVSIRVPLLCVGREKLFQGLLLLVIALGREVLLHTVSIIHQNRDALLESVFNRTPWTARSVGSGMAHTEASQTAPHPWIHLASPVAAQTPVKQDPSTSAPCAGLGHAPSFVTTAIVGGSALRHEPTTITVVLAPHAGRQEASIIRSISGLTGSSPEGPGSMIFPASMKREEELKMKVQAVCESMINQTPTPRRRVLVPLKAFVVQVASACLVGTATRQSPKAAPALALVAAAAVAPVPSVRADHFGHSSADGACGRPRPFVLVWACSRSY